MTILTETHLAPEAAGKATRFARRMLQAWSHRRRSRQTGRVLQKLSDRLLRDIGLDTLTDRELQDIGVRREVTGRFSRRI